MSVIIYILTVVYFAYVIYVSFGDEINSFFKSALRR